MGTERGVGALAGLSFLSTAERTSGQREVRRIRGRVCRKFYALTMGRRGLAPGIYFRSLLIGYFEGIDSERGIASRLADSLAPRQFVGIALTESTPDHSTISRTRRLIDVETHREVFDWVLGLLADRGLLRGKWMGVDATTLEVSAAMRLIVRRDTGESYDEFLTGLAKASGIEEMVADKGVSLRCGAETAEGSSGAQLRSGAAAEGVAPLEGQEWAAVGGVPEPAAGAGQLRKELAETARRAGGTQLRILLRHGRHAAHASAQALEHPDAAVDSCRRFNLSLIFHRLLGAGTPREWKSLGGAVFVLRLLMPGQEYSRPCRSPILRSQAIRAAAPSLPARSNQCRRIATYTTG